MKKLLSLKLALLERDTTARAVARKTGIPESYLSMAINGRYILNDEQKTKIADALGKSKSEVFNNTAA